MSEINYDDMVRTLAKPGAEIAASVSQMDCLLIDSASEIFHVAAVILKKANVRKMHSSAQHAHIAHMAIGIAGEAGELLDAVKKAVIYRKPIDRENVIEELGDLKFYMVGYAQGVIPALSSICQMNLITASLMPSYNMIKNILEISEEEVIQGNIKKLSVRYEKLVYSDTAAQERADKKGPDLAQGSYTPAPTAPAGWAPPPPAPGPVPSFLSPPAPCVPQAAPRMERPAPPAVPLSKSPTFESYQEHNTIMDEITHSGSNN